MNLNESIYKFSNSALPFLFLIGIYLDISPSIGGVIVPSISITFFLGLYIFFGKLSLRYKEIVFISCVAIICLVAEIMSYQPFSMLKISGQIHFLYAMLVYAFIFSCFYKIDNIDQIIILLFVIFIVGGSLEYFGYTRGLSNLVTDFLYPDVKINIERERALAGSERIRFFSMEPSHFTMFVVFLSCLLISVKCTFKRFLYLIICLGCIFYYQRSPTLILGYIYICIIAFINFKGAFIKLALIIISLSILVLFRDSLFSRFNFENFNPNLFRSESVRVTIPLVSAIDVLRSGYPGGLGVGGDYNISNFSSLPYDSSILIGNSSIPRLIIVSGLFGSINIILLLIVYYRSYSFRSMYQICLFLFLFSFSTGGITTVYLWAILGVFSATVVKNEKTRLRYKIR